MFKSVFAKYVTVVMAIFTFGLAILLVVLTSITGNMLTDRVSDDMDRIGEAATEYLKAVLPTEQPIASFPQRVEACFSDGNAHMESIFSSLLAANSDMSLLLSDTEGRIFCRYTEETVYWHEGIPLPIRHENLTVLGSDETVPARIEQLFSYEVLLYTEGIFDEGGEKLGYLSVVSPTGHNGRMMEELTNTIISAVLLVLLAVMIAVYLISERVTSPLREMSAVARKMANGEFGSRVRVQGSDEVAELAVAFNNMAESLENLEKMRSSFIANVSHDLRTPMTTIAGFIDGIRDGVIVPEERDHYLGVISEEVKRLSRLVSSLLDLSRLQAGDRKFHPAPFDICEMARLILISFEQKIEEKRLEVEFECCQDRVAVLADRDAIYQVFYNLSHNAIKFAREGGLLRIRIREKNHNKIEVSVYNEGQGIPAEDLPYVFERFYKSDKSRGLDKNGVGLGLFISKTIVEAHGERIRVESEDGKDCEFLFTLPLSSGRDGAEEAHGPKGDSKI